MIDRNLLQTAHRSFDLNGRATAVKSSDVQCTMYTDVKQGSPEVPATSEIRF